MNKNNGFTLIEMLIVVALTALIGVIVTMSLTKTLKNTEQRECSIFVNEIENGACTYVTLSTKTIRCERPGCTISVNTLYEEGFINKETDPCTGKEISTILNNNVAVAWDEKGNKTCTYDGVRVYER